MGLISLSNEFHNNKEVRDIKTYRKGSVTVEASILLPLIAVLIIFLITVILVEYEKAIVRTTTENAAYAIAQHHNPKFKLDVDDVVDYSGDGNQFSARTIRKTVNVDSEFDLYWRIFHDENYREELLITYNAIIPELIIITGDKKNSTGDIANPDGFIEVTDRGDEIKVSISRGGNIISPNISVESELTYKIPLGVLIGIEEYKTVTKVTVPVVDNAEFIRNYGLAKDMVSQLPGVGTVLDKIDEMTSGIE